MEKEVLSRIRDFLSAQPGGGSRAVLGYTQQYKTELAVESLKGVEEHKAQVNACHRALSALLGREQGLLVYSSVWRGAIMGKVYREAYARLQSGGLYVLVDYASAETDDPTRLSRITESQLGSQNQEECPYRIKESKFIEAPDLLNDIEGLAKTQGRAPPPRIHKRIGALIAVIERPGPNSPYF